MTAPTPQPDDTDTQGAYPPCPNCGVRPDRFTFMWGVWHFGPLHRLSQRLKSARKPPKTKGERS